MKLRFEPDLPHQDAAIAAVADLFAGQDIGHTEFTVARGTAVEPELAFGTGHGNRLRLLDDEILANLRAVQARHGLPLSETLDMSALDFTVEMETGTGKTYVYLRTIFEMNRRYGWTKFVIVVPSVAIREGVAKTLEITRDHFRSLYAGVPMDWFVYDSQKLGQVRDFATSASIKVMVATIGALNKVGEEGSGNVFYKPHEKVGGDRPVDLVRGTRPVLIVDEPQSVEGADTNGAGARAIRTIQPLCTLRYSATHLIEHHMVYRLDAFDAHAQGLVKQIVVAGLETDGAHNSPYLRFDGIRPGRGTPEATVTVGLQRATGVVRGPVTVRDGDDLADVTARALYANHCIGTIQRKPPLFELQTPGETVWLQPGQTYGDQHADDIRRKMINQTIREHFERELRLKPLGIKVLSLFFVDHVASYREWGEDGTTTLGPLGRMFEEEYRRLATHPDFRTTLFAGIVPDPSAAHDGYFSRDRQGRNVETETNTREEPKNAAAREAAERGYRLIMRDKERLLDEREPLRFIFSHSALREGWDNPNVFQICVLRSMGGDRQRRQTLGRGLRLCVDGRTGARRRDQGLNTLTVIADEDFQSYADGLQSEMERDLGLRFGIVEENSFARLSYEAPNGTPQPVGIAESQALFRHLRAADLVDTRGRITDALRTHIKAGTLALPAEFDPFAPAVRAHLARLAARLPVQNKAKRVAVGINTQVLHGDDFRALWDRISPRTTYHLAFDETALVTAAAAALREMPQVTRAQAWFRRAMLSVERGGLAPGPAITSAQSALTANDSDLPDLLGELQNRTNLTRRSLVAALTESGRLNDFRANPAAFINAASAAISRAKRTVLVNGIKYERRGDAGRFEQSLFQTVGLTGYLDNMVNVQKGVTQRIVFDSGVEERFARDLDASSQVKVFAKLPGWFTVPTPLGSYNPDWAVLVESSTQTTLYLVIETKSDLLELDEIEKSKTTCGKKHYAALAEASDGIGYHISTSIHEVLAAIVE